MCDVEGISLHLSEICITTAIESGKRVTTLVSWRSVNLVFFFFFCRAGL